MTQAELHPSKKLEFEVPNEHQEAVKLGNAPKVLLTTRLKIVNKSGTERLVYKLKTNAPKSYKVQPT